MPQLDNPRHERFCQLVAKGLKGAAAYRKVYGDGITGARQHASALMSNHDISERVEELQEKGAEGVAFSLRETHDFIRKVVETPPGDIDEHSPLCQSFKYTAESREIKLPCKLRALELSARLSGFLRDRVELEMGDDFAEFITLLRKGQTETIDSAPPSA